MTLVVYPETIPFMHHASQFSDSRYHSLMLPPGISQNIVLLLLQLLLNRFITVQHTEDVLLPACPRVRSYCVYCMIFESRRRYPLKSLTATVGSCLQVVLMGEVIYGLSVSLTHPQYKARSESQFIWCIQMKYIILYGINSLYSRTIRQGAASFQCSEWNEILLLPGSVGKPRHRQTLQSKGRISIVHIIHLGSLNFSK